MPNERLKGRRYVALVRCSTDQQTETSIADQKKLLAAFAAANGLIPAGDDVVLEGVSGSKPAAREDIQKLLDRKRDENDFDVLLIQDMSRLTRSGSEHGGYIEFQLRKAGIKLVVASGSIPDGEHAGIIKSVEYFSAQQYARSVSFSASRGQMSAIQDGRMAYCLVPPYGVDRLYRSSDGRPLYVLRNLPSGLQQKLDPQTQAILQTYPRGQRHQKQKSERIELIRGEPALVAVVQQIYRRHLVDGWGAWRIAKELKNQGVSGPKNKHWSTQTVRSILRNPIYTGRGIANRSSHAIYNMRSANCPKAANATPEDRATCKNQRVRLRPRTDWVEQKFPALEGYLGSELADLARAFHERVVNDIPPQPRVKADKHVDSPFILKGILISRQGGYPLSGRTGGPKGKSYRSYRISSASSNPSSEKTMRRLVPAERIEQAVLKAVRDTLLSIADLRPKIEDAIRRQISGMENDSRDQQQLLAEEQRISDQIEFVIEEFSQIGKDAAKAKIQQLELQLREIKAQLSKGNQRQRNAHVNVPALADKILQRISELGNKLDQLPKQALRSVLMVLISRLEIDMETFVCELELALPSSAMLKNLDLGEELGLEATPSGKACPETQWDIELKIAVFDCERTEKSCYQCHRRAA